jgi:hypothetical protein
MDQIWIRLIVELRSFGISLDNIKTIYNQLRKNDIDYIPSVYPRLEFYIHYFINYKTPIKLIILKDYKVFICTKEELEGAEKEDLLDSYISINLHKLIQLVLKKSFYKPNYKEEIVLSDKERILLVHIRNGNYKSINIVFKDGTMKLLEKRMNNNETEIHKILKKQKYSEIIMKTENGIVVNIQYTEKVKI